jgi:hypothetical protein
MVDITKPLALPRSVSGFITSARSRGANVDTEAEVGRAIELAYLEPAPVSQAVRIAVTLALVIAAKLVGSGTLG